MKIDAETVIGTLFYLGIGLLVHVVFFADPFSWADPITYIVMVLWPFGLFFVFIWWVIIIIIIFAAVGLIVFVYDEMNFKKLKRTRARRRHQKP